MAVPLAHLPTHIRLKADKLGLTIDKIFMIFNILFHFVLNKNNIVWIFVFSQNSSLLSFFFFLILYDLLLFILVDNDFYIFLFLFFSFSYNR